MCAYSRCVASCADMSWQRVVPPTPGQGWVLENERAEGSAAAAENARAHGLRSFVRGSSRLRMDCLWHAATKRFVAVFAFSRWCMGPPGMVHGGCLFACLDDAISRLLFSRAVTDLGANGGLMLTGESILLLHLSTTPAAACSPTKILIDCAASTYPYTRFIQVLRIWCSIDASGLQGWCYAGCRIHCRRCNCHIQCG
jgi:hypothetical protein